MKKHTAEREGISKLPEPILHHILSFLPQKEAVRTCVLSKSWRHLGSTQPKYCLKESYFEKDKEKFVGVLKKSLQVYSDQKLCIEDFSVSIESTVGPELKSLLDEWIPILILELGVKKFDLSCCRENWVNFYVPSAVFESESLKQLCLQNCDLRPINYTGNKYFPGLTCLRLTRVHLSNEWFNSFSRDYFPCLEELELCECNGFDELKLSSRSIKKLDILMDESTTKATINAPSINKFYFQANISQSISFTTTSSIDWNSRIHLSLDLDASLWFRKLSGLVAAFSQSQINSLVLYHPRSKNREHTSPISLYCANPYKMPVAVKSLTLILDGLYYDSFFKDFMNGLVCVIRPREINQHWYVGTQQGFQRIFNEVSEFLCRTLQRIFNEVSEFLEEVSLEVCKCNGSGSEKWHPVQGTISWSEYVVASLPSLGFYKLRFRLKWRELDDSFDCTL